MYSYKKMTTAIMDMIHGEDVYKDLSVRESDLQGWGGHPEFFRKIINMTALPHRDFSTETAIEVGSWKGKSAVTIATLLKEICKFPPTLICVDTWLGATEFWVDKTSEKRFKSLARVNGYPSVYFQFLSNVLSLGLHDTIVPFPQSSINAARFLKKNKIKADLIYVDASHEYEDVLADLRAYWSLLSTRGIMCGDDYCTYWPGVIEAVGQFARENRLTVRHERYDNPDGEAPSDYWWLEER